MSALAATASALATARSVFDLAGRRLAQDWRDQGSVTFRSEVVTVIDTETAGALRALQEADQAVDSVLRALRAIRCDV
ncbi:hypothetical protein [Umezawaea sp. Da 62-37]|uniref:hypothetical protein n=1 Tax=Umezawaea sp. Da 62-37 TaxID=3075927 RepID=UPI0028F6EFCC|nr:hypothetical protein [Umezawaea sp. Da 62-37]WNV90388.1 hypothetical protein RM788_19530 [Umezawaea sp. Da 62-37]